MTTTAENIYLVYHDKVSAYIRGKVDNYHDAEDPDEALEALADALMTLKERERDLILLHYYKGMTLKAAAEKMGMSYINAKVIHKKALSALRNYFQET